MSSPVSLSFSLVILAKPESPYFVFHSALPLLLRTPGLQPWASQSGAEPAYRSAEGKVLGCLAVAFVFVVAFTLLLLTLFFV